MTNKDPYLDEKIATIADFVGRDFMRLARELLQLQEQRSDMFVEVAEQVGIGRRKSFALARIARIFNDLNIPDERLNRIGWAKLNRISGHLDEDNALHLLALAEDYTFYELDAILKGKQPVDGAKVLLLHLPEDIHSRFREVLIKHGARPTASGGLSGKERALANLLAELTDS
nr:hypothetical protein [Rhizobium sp. ACO-34A]